MTVKQNLAYAGGAPEKIDDILEKTELIKCADKRPGELSGGEKQRVSLARAFLIPSELLLMDEPFSSLDTALKIRLTEVFARLWKSLPEKRTAVFVTHDLEEALMLADRIIVLKSGQVAADVSLKREVFPSAYAGALRGTTKIAFRIAGRGKVLKICKNDVKKPFASVYLFDNFFRLRYDIIECQSVLYIGRKRRRKNYERIGNFRRTFETRSF